MKLYIKSTCTSCRDAKAALKAAGVPLFGYGQFVSVLINFVILAFIVFLLVKVVNRAIAVVHEEQKAGVVPPAADPPEVALLREIRDELRAAKVDPTPLP